MSIQEYQPVIGLEVHAELQTRSKMFCACPVVDATTAEPNTAVCPVCAGMPGTLPVVNEKAVEYALRVALALECTINQTSIFARKNYFYPDLPKGYQISQYELPLARNGRLVMITSQGERTIRVRRVHLEEDTGKLTHLQTPDGRTYSLVDLNRAGVPLLEIVSEPDMHSVEEAVAYATTLRQILRYLGVNSGDMEKGVIRFEANVSVRPKGNQRLGTRTEIKNLNSFRALERAVAQEIERQIALLERGETVQQQTLGWNEAEQRLFAQRSKEEAHDYRYFPEPDLPPLVVEEAWLETVRASLPELPRAKRQRFMAQYGLPAYDAQVLTQERSVADFFEQTVAAAGEAVPPKMVANWITGEMFALWNASGRSAEDSPVAPEALAELLGFVGRGQINQNTAKQVLAEMAQSGRSAQAIIEARGLRQVSDEAQIARWVDEVLAEFPKEVETYLNGKEGVANFLFGQVMRKARGKANPQVVRQVLLARLAQRKRLDEAPKLG
ncbi:MAG TPA: Asp-tRNA(Asn)/Glu-tRNA(Gln) amidotransferase subunit GatB [Anaerolineae bacterium]|nr:Asp-tRNA(Asn)/Glu-tRNA(Gln) amidotransferase subunit GatB [Anaerolineae bacterium]